MSDFRKDIGKRIKESRIALKPRVTQQNMAEKLNVTRQTVNDLEVGKTSPKSEVLIKLSYAIKKPVDWILTGDNPINSFSKMIDGIPEDEKEFYLNEILDIIKKELGGE